MLQFPFHLQIRRGAVKRRRRAKQTDLVLALEGRLADAVLLSVMKVTHRHAKRGERFETGPAIGGRMHMAELAGPAPTSRNDAGKTAHLLLVMQLLGYCVID
jgi:hypothetical protein